MYVSRRLLVVTFSVLFVAACSGGGPAAAALTAKCTPGTTSIPGMLSDPCKQVGTMCPGVAAAACEANGVWGQCFCGGAQPAPVTTTNAVTQMPQCGNNIVETNLGEQCEQGMNGGATCAALVAPDSQGVVNCSACRYDTSGCMTPPTVPTGGTGARMPQGGAGH